MRTCPKCQRTYADHIDSCPEDATALVSAAGATQAELESTLGRKFRLVRRLGAGGMGTVFLAEQIAVGNRPVALKILLRKLIDDPEFLLRFQNEAASTGRIHHANVVTIYESGQADDGSPYIAMEYLDGESLRQALTRRGSFPIAECASIIGQAARGLNAAHKLGIIHRDLKPDNIFLTRGDEGEIVVKVVDFGIAKLRESATHTMTGTVLGTPAYMSFEQASGMKSEELDARSDVYSLGVVAYEMLTGRVPFHSDTPLGYVRKHLSEEPPPFRAAKPGLAASPELEAVVMKALAKDRDARFSSVMEFARAFACAAQASQPAASDVALPSTKIVRPAAGAVHEPPPTPLSAAPRAESGGPEASPTSPPVPRQEDARARPAPPHGVPPFANVRQSGEPKKKPKKISMAFWIGLAFVAVLALGYYVQIKRRWIEPIFWPITKVTAGPAKVNAKDGLKYVWIPPGTFMMGCSPGDSECDAAEKPAHQVTITNGFWMGQTEVTVGAYKRFAAATRRPMPDAPTFNGGWVDDSMPIVNVNWNDAHDYCAWAGARLPTEAEWEYAARGGSAGAHYGNVDEIAWCINNSRGRTHEVAQKRANGFGLFDVLGNVWEWVNDWYDQNYYQSSPSQDPPGPASGNERILRGGSWGDYPRDDRVSNRVGVNATDRDTSGGFRCGGEVFAP